MTNMTVLEQNINHGLEGMEGPVGHYYSFGLARGLSVSLAEQYAYTMSSVNSLVRGVLRDHNHHNLSAAKADDLMEFFQSVGARAFKDGRV